MRVLDIDVDFFVRPVAYLNEDDGPRLSDDDYETWTEGAVLAFLRDQCGLSRKLPGWAIEHHDEAFSCWRDAIGVGWLKPPFHVTHVDAHADVRLGDNGYWKLITEVMYLPVEERCTQGAVQDALNFANWLAFAAACRWISDLDYVFGEGGGSDMLAFHMSDDGRAIEMKAATEAQLDRALHRIGGERLQAQHRDPPIPVRQIRAEDFAAVGGYDAIVVCQSPGYTPPAADAIYELIREMFVDEPSR